MDATFIDAFNATMKWEVGSWWDPLDPDVIAGSIGNSYQRRKVGYTNVMGDNGGITKYGVAQSSHPNLCIGSITLADAQQIYFNEYWLPVCPKLPSVLQGAHFDGCVNIGSRQAAKSLQLALGFSGPQVDGDIGPKTLAAINAADPQTLLTALYNVRYNYYIRIVQRDPSQERFKNGWLSRIAAVFNR